MFEKQRGGQRSQSKVSEGKWGGNKVGVLASRQIILGLIGHVKGSGFLFYFYFLLLF